MRGFGLPRWLIVVAAALALIVVAGTVALKVLFPPEKLRAMIVPRIEERVGSEVMLSDVRLRVFPRIAVRLDDFAIANPRGFSAEPALRLDALERSAASTADSVQSRRGVQRSFCGAARWLRDDAREPD